jgi:hypothetical protein
MVVPARSAVALANLPAPTMRKAQPAAALKRSRLPPVLAQRTRLVPESAAPCLQAVPRCPVLQVRSVAAAGQRESPEALPARSVVEQRKRAGLRAEWEPRLRALRE